MHEARSHSERGRSVWFRLLLVCLTPACLLGCGGEEATRVTLWHQMRPGDRKVLEERLEEFRAQNPGADVRALYKETEELRSGVESAVLAGHGPEIVYGPSDAVGIYHTIGGVQDMSPWFSAEECGAFDERALVRLPRSGESAPEELVFVGDRFGNHLALVYNRDYLPEPPKTAAEFVEAAKTNTVDENGDGRPERYGVVWNYTEPFFVVPFLTGFGSWILDDSGDGPPVPTLDNNAAVAAYEYVADLKLKHQVLPRSADYEAAASLFLSGKSAMILDGDWSWQKYLSEPGIDAAVGLLPTVESTGLPMASTVAPKGYSLTVAAQGADRELAVELIRFLTSEETQRVFLQKQKVLPSRLAVRDDPLIENDPTLRVGLELAERGPLMPTATELRAVWDAMRPPYQALMAGQLSPEDAAAEMQSDAVEKIEIMTSEVEPDGSATLVQALGLLLLVGGLVYFRGTFVEFFRDLPRQPLSYVFVLPAIAVIFLTVLFPLVYNVVLSFSNMSLANFHDWEIVGLRNYGSMLAGDGAWEFWELFGWTVFWTVINVAFHVSLGVLLAVVINGPVRGKSIYRVMLIIPWAVPAYITALTWRGMFDYEFGAVNHLITALNGYLPTALQLPLLDWLKTAGPAFAACIVANVWLGFPFMMVIALGGLQGIPKELYEAASIDGASRLRQFWTVTVPMLKPVLLPAVTLGSIWTFNNLNVVWLVSNGGEPSDQTHILVSYVYKAVFNLYQYGSGAALSMVIFFILLAFSMTFLRSAKATENVYG